MQLEHGSLQGNSPRLLRDNVVKFQVTRFLYKIQDCFSRLMCRPLLDFLCSFSDFFHSMLANSDKFKALKCWYLMYILHRPIIVKRDYLKPVGHTDHCSAQTNASQVSPNWWSMWAPLQSSFKPRTLLNASSAVSEEQKEVWVSLYLESITAVVNWGV